MNGRIRGRVDWCSTYKARHTGNVDPTVFVCLQSWRHFDQPENQLLKFMLHRIQLCLERLPRGMQIWQAWGRSLSVTQGEPLTSYFALLAHRIRMCSAHAHLREVDLPTSISAQHLLAARTSKNELYAHAVGLYDLYQQVVATPDWMLWADVVDQTLPLPANAHEIGRLLAMLRPTR